MSAVTSIVGVGRVRPISSVKRGWHVWSPDERWRLVEQVAVYPLKRRVHVTFADDTTRPLGYDENENVRTRTPAEQIHAVIADERRRKSLFESGYAERQGIALLVAAIWGEGEAVAS